MLFKCVEREKERKKKGLQGLGLEGYKINCYRTVGEAENITKKIPKTVSTKHTVLPHTVTQKLKQASSSKPSPANIFKPEHQTPNHNLLLTKSHSLKL